MPYYKALHPKTVNDVFQSPSCSIAVMNKNFGEMKLRAFMVNIIIDLVMFFNVGKTMKDTQAAQTADLIIEEFYFFKPDDFKLCFNRAKKGLYGKVYDRIDGAVILEWLGRYEQERGSIAMDDSTIIPKAGIYRKVIGLLKHWNKRTMSLGSMILNENIRCEYLKTRNYNARK